MRPQARIQGNVTATGLLADAKTSQVNITGERFDFLVGSGGGNSFEVEALVGSSEYGNETWSKVGNLTVADGHTFYEAGTELTLRVNCQTFSAQVPFDIRATHTNRQ